MAGSRAWPYRAFAACTGMLLAAIAAATDSGSMTVSTSVSGTCKFTTATFAMNFGTLDPLNASDQTSKTALTLKCTKNVSASAFSFDGVATSPATIQITNGTNSIPVTLAWAAPVTAGSGFGPGSTSISMTVTGTILGANYAAAAAGTYTRNVTVVVGP